MGTWTLRVPQEKALKEFQTLLKSGRQGEGLKIKTSASPNGFRV